MESSERFMCECRKYLRIADEYERQGLIELADAAGAIAANKVAAALRVGERRPVLRLAA